MLCEPAEGKRGWLCLIRKDEKWKEFGKFSQVKLEGKPVNLPITGGKVMFDKKGCSIVKEDGRKILDCRK